jgi:tRNA pseudouridine55 synthase
MYHGILNIYKEAGYTSHDVVAKLRGICGQKRIGHTGTLDPEATGVLPVALGNATGLCGLLTEQDKEYVAVLRLGVATDTQDLSGRILRERPVAVGEEEFRAAAAQFQGEYRQVPPMYSALKIGGKKLYELARAGKEVERRPRPVTVYWLEILEIALPEARIKVSCSKGTYIRTLCADIGEKLGCGAAMASLERTKAGRFGGETAVTLGDARKLAGEGRLEEILWPADAFFADCPALHVAADAMHLLRNGNQIAPGQTLEKEAAAPGRVRMYGADASFYGVYAYDGERKRYQPVKMFLPDCVAQP